MIEEFKLNRYQWSKLLQKLNISMEPNNPGKVIRADNIVVSDLSLFLYAHPSPEFHFAANPEHFGSLYEDDLWESYEDCTTEECQSGHSRAIRPAEGRELEAFADVISRLRRQMELAAKE